MNSWIPKCHCELFNKRKKNQERGCTDIIITRAWSSICEHSLTLVTWQRNWVGAGGDWADLGKSFE